ncbi:MAG: sensor histidine kinase, partial [Povalibacter sp.]
AIALVGPWLFFNVARQRPDLGLRSFSKALLTFGVSSALALATNAWNLWHTNYWLQTCFELVAAFAGMVSLWFAVRAMPALLEVPRAADLQAARESASQAAHELETFTASVSHDLRAPLSSIAGQAGMLEIGLGERATDDQKRRLHRIQISVKQVSELIESLLMLSRISRVTLHMERIDLTALAEDITRELKQQDPQREAQVEIQPGMSLVGDRKLVATLLNNLLSNAWRFTSRNAASRIEVGAVPGTDDVTLHVRDNGLGFDMAYQEKLFQPFQKLHGNDLSGSGMGLAMVKRIIERHGGRAWAEGKLNEGSIFYCSIPVKDSPTSVR